MPYDANDHARFRDDVGAYLAGGLTDDERRAFEAHAADCPACAAGLSDAAAEERKLQDMFAHAIPSQGFEDRILGRFRAGAAAPDRWRTTIHLHPAVRRAAVGAAAVVMLAGFGYVASQQIEKGGLPMPWSQASAPVHTASNLRGIGQGITQYANESKGVSPRTYVPDAESRPAATPAEMAQSFNKSLSDTLHRGGEPAQDEYSTQEAAGRWHYAFRQPAAKPGQSGAAATGGVMPGMPGMYPGMYSGMVPGGGTALNGQLQNDQSKPGGQQAGGRPGAMPGGFGGYGGAVGGAGFGGGGFRDNISSGVPPAPPAAADNRAAGAAPESAEAKVQSLAKREPVRGDVSDRKQDLSSAYRGFRPADQKGWALGVPPEDGAKNVDPKAGGPEGEKDKAVRELQNRLAQTEGGRRDFAERIESAPQSSSSGEAANPATPQPATAPTQPANAAQPTNAGRKIIRNGEMSFEVDSFDSAFLQITKIAGEEGGFVATTDSEKLANGKVRGVVTVRVPPERLDTLVLKLRGLGELKSSKIAAQDITKQYTDLESQLKAARAMEERLLNVIKTGKGTIKELVEAEKQLGVYREKIEHIEGEVRYYNNLVSLSTLNVTLTERDIRAAALLSETEQVNMGVEAEDVEKARASAIKAIEEAKGRIVESDLKKLEAGQFAARITADVPPDAAGPLIDRMRQVGTVARLEISRKQTTPEGTVAPAQGSAALPRVERRDTRFLISLYNLANVAPRQTTTLNLAAEDVEDAYRAVLDQVKSAGGRIVTSQLNRPRPDQTTGTVTFEAPADKADVLLGAVRGTGDVMRLDVTQNPDTQNVTETKRGFALQIFSLASVAPRETTQLRLAARGVPDAFNKLRETVRTTKGGRVLTSQLAQQDPASVTGTLDFEVRRDDWPAIDAALREAGQVVSRSVSRSSDTENTVDSKIRLQVTLVDEAALAPRESLTMQLAVPDVPDRYAKLLEALGAAQARVLQSQLNEQDTRTNVTATLAFDVRRESRAAVDKALADAGDVVSRSVARSTDVQNTLDDKVRFTLTMIDADRLAPRETAVLGIEARDVENAKEAIESLALSLGGRVVDSTLSRETNGRVMGKVIADVPLGKAMEMVSKTRGQGRVQFRRDSRDENVPAGPLSRYRVDVTLANEELIVESGQGLASRISAGLRTSVAGLLWSVQLIVVGLFLVAPWALIVWFAWRLVRRGRSRKAPPTPATIPA
jgi:glycine cleavage system regulatory protein